MIEILSCINRELENRYSKSIKMENEIFFFSVNHGRRYLVPVVTVVTVGRPSEELPLFYDSTKATITLIIETKQLQSKA